MGFIAKASNLRLPAIRPPTSQSNLSENTITPSHPGLPIASTIRSSTGFGVFRHRICFSKHASWRLHSRVEYCKTLVWRFLLHEHEWNPVRTFCKIIAELSNRRWSAWFPQVSEIQLSGTKPVDAICKLLRYFGEHQFEASKIHVLHYGCYDGHLEYMIPMLNDRRIPISTANNDSVYPTASEICDRLDGHSAVFDELRFEDSREFD